MTSSRFVILTAILCLTATVRAQDSWEDYAFGNRTVAENFARCMCWNPETANFCDTSVNTWNAKACSQLAVQLYWWIIPAFVLICFFCIFPMCFCLSRLICNCCGGKQPSHGICCPTSNRVVAAQRGLPEYTRQYPVSTTVLAKTLAATATIAFLSISIWFFVTVPHAETAFVDTVAAMRETATDLYEEANRTANALSALEGASFLPAEAQSLSANLASLLSSSQDVVEGFKDVEKGEPKYVGGRLDAIVGVPLCLVVLLTALGLANVRGFPISCGMSCISFLGAFLTFFLVLFVGISGSNMVICENFNETAVPFATAVLQSAHGCGSSSATALKRTVNGYVAQVCSQGLATLCQTSFNCEANPCNSSDPNSTLVASVLANARTPAGKSIDQCATGPSECGETVYQTTQSVTTVASDYGAAVAMIVPIIEDLEGCSAFRSDLAARIHPTLCGNFQASFHHLAMQLVGLVVLTLALMFIYIYGAKRFTAPGSDDASPEDAPLMAYSLGHPVNYGFSGSNQKAQPAMVDF